MHPPVFRLTQLLSDWPDCRLELRCRCSPRVTFLPVRMLLERGDRPFATVIGALRCAACRSKPALVYLIAGQNRNGRHGPPPDWSVQLVGDD